MYPSGGKKHERKDMAHWSQSSPHVMSSSPAGFTSGPLPGLAPPSAAVMSPPLYRQTHNIPSSDLVQPAVQVEELETGRSLIGHKHPAPRPLWKNGWRPTSVTCTVPKLHQFPSSPVDEFSTSFSAALDLPCDSSGHNLVLHSIDLQCHIQEVKSMINVLPNRQDLLPGSDQLKKAPAIPSRFFDPNTPAIPYDPLKPPRCKLPQVLLDKKSSNLLLRKSVATICTHTGYERSSTQALDTLSDVLAEFLSRLSKLLRINSDRQAEQSGVAFQDVLDQSLFQCGIAGKSELQRYWTQSVKGYASKLQQLASAQLEEYKQLTDPTSDVAVPSIPKNTEFKLPSLWPAATPDVPVEEELHLDEVMQQANLDNVLHTRTPDLGGPVLFPPFAEQAPTSHEPEAFTPLTLDGPPRKRLRTMSLEQHSSS